MKLMIVYQKKPANTANVPSRQVHGSALPRGPEIIDKGEADVRYGPWQKTLEAYWWVTFEPAPFLGERELSSGSFTYRCYRYRKDVLGYSDEDACTNKGLP